MESQRNKLPPLSSLINGAGGSASPTNDKHISEHNGYTGSPQNKFQPTMMPIPHIQQLSQQHQQSQQSQQSHQQQPKQQQQQQQSRVSKENRSTTASYTAINNGDQHFMNTINKPKSKTKTTRKKHKNSHLGCGTCKQRRIKCDETLPSCKNCGRAKLRCAYLSLDENARSALRNAQIVSKMKSNEEINSPSGATISFQSNSRSKNLSLQLEASSIAENGQHSLTKKNLLDMSNTHISDTSVTKHSISISNSNHSDEHYNMSDMSISVDDHATSGMIPTNKPLPGTIATSFKPTSLPLININETKPKNFDFLIKDTTAFYSAERERVARAFTEPRFFYSYIFNASSMYDAMSKFKNVKGISSIKNKSSYEILRILTLSHKELLTMKLETSEDYVNYVENLSSTVIPMMSFYDGAFNSEFDKSWLFLFIHKYADLIADFSQRVQPKLISGIVSAPNNTFYNNSLQILQIHLQSAFMFYKAFFFPAYNAIGLASILELLDEVFYKLFGEQSSYINGKYFSDSFNRTRSQFLAIKDFVQALFEFTKSTSFKEKDYNSIVVLNGLLCKWNQITPHFLENIYRNPYQMILNCFCQTISTYLNAIFPLVRPIYFFSFEGIFFPGSGFIRCGNVKEYLDNVVTENKFDIKPEDLLKFNDLIASVMPACISCSNINEFLCKRENLLQNYLNKNCIIEKFINPKIVEFERYLEKKMNPSFNYESEPSQSQNKSYKILREYPNGTKKEIPIEDRNKNAWYFQEINNLSFKISHKPITNNVTKFLTETLENYKYTKIFNIEEYQIENFSVLRNPNYNFDQHLPIFEFKVSNITDNDFNVYSLGPRLPDFAVTRNYLVKCMLCDSYLNQATCELGSSLRNLEVWR